MLESYELPFTKNENCPKRAAKSSTRLFTHQAGNSRVAHRVGRFYFMFREQRAAGTNSKDIKLQARDAHTQT